MSPRWHAQALRLPWARETNTLCSLHACVANTKCIAADGTLDFLAGSVLANGVTLMLGMSHLLIYRSSKLDISEAIKF